MSATTMPDGSTVVVDRRDRGSAIISRYVGDRCVWGQVFSRGGDGGTDALITEVLENIAADPGAFHRWWLR